MLPNSGYVSSVPKVTKLCRGVTAPHSPHVSTRLHFFACETSQRFGSPKIWVLTWIVQINDNQPQQLGTSTSACLHLSGRLLQWRRGRGLSWS